MEAEQIEALARVGKKRRLFEDDPAHVVDIGKQAVERLLEHRDPFLLVDRVTHVDLAGETIVGERYIDPADPLFKGHFPKTPIYPGVLQVEAMGQLGLCLFALRRLGRKEVRADDVAPAVRGLKIHHAVFLAPVEPGARLVMRARSLEQNDYTGLAVGQAFCGGDTPCCFAIMEVYFVDA